MKKELFIVHYTHDLQGYNEHYVYLNYEDAKSMYDSMLEDIHKKDTINEVYEENENEFYYEHSDGYSRLYIEEHKINPKL